MKKQEFIDRYGEEAYKKWREQSKKWIAEHNGYCKNYYQSNKARLLDSHNKWLSIPINKAKQMCLWYNREDTKYNRGNCTLTPEWIVDNIFNSKCIYCGETDWRKLGCDRIDNSKPHTPDNVVCCCGKCNVKKQRKSVEVFLNTCV